MLETLVDLGLTDDWQHMIDSTTVRGHSQAELDDGPEIIVEMTPRAYDEQKVTRLTLFHAMLHYILGRIWIAANTRDVEFAALISRLGTALGNSRYLDGHPTNWGMQFWAMLWERRGGAILE